MELFFRRNLPHWQPIGAAFFITYRLAGTLPGIVIAKLKKEYENLRALPKKPGYSDNEWSVVIDKKMFALWDKYLDEDRNMKWLSKPQISDIIRESIYYFAGKRYSLWAYVIMPNHVHILIQVDEAWDKNKKAEYEKGALSAILHSLRSYTAKEANKVLGRTGKFWQSEAYDYWARNNDELQRIIYYIENNPVKAGLVEKPEDWKYSSAYDRIQKGLGKFEKIV